MPWPKLHPVLEVFVPHYVVPGQPFHALARVCCREPTVLESLWLLVDGVAISRTDYGLELDPTPLGWLSAPLLTSRTELPAGEHPFSASFQLACDAPASYRGKALSVEWMVRVEAKLAGQPAYRVSYPLYVVPAPSLGNEPPAPGVFKTFVDPRGRRPYAEVALGSTAVEAGGYLLGRVALANTVGDQHHSVDVLLGLREYPQHLGQPLAVKHRWVVPVASLEPGASTELALQLPYDLIPGFRVSTVGLEWYLVISVGRRGSGLDVRITIPITVRGRRVQGAAPAELAAPEPVGSERLDQVWSEVARRSGWSYRAGELRRALADCHATIRREQPAAARLRLRGDLRFRDLDLGLHLEEGRLRVRDESQSQVLAEHTDAIARRGMLVAADDQRIVCILADTGAQVVPLVGFASWLEALAQALVAAHAQLPPPADMLESVPWFVDAARRLGGMLEPASMDIWGVRDELAFSLQAQWNDDGALVRTVLEVRPTLPVDGRWHQRWVGLGEPGPMPEGLAALMDGATGLVVDARSIQLAFPPCRDELDPLVARLEGLLEVARRLSGLGLGYR